MLLFVLLTMSYLILGVGTYKLMRISHLNAHIDFTDSQKIKTFLVSSMPLLNIISFLLAYLFYVESKNFKS